MIGCKRTQLLCLKSINVRLRNSSYISSNSEQKVKQFQTKQFEEIQIPVPWGHIAGKWYGPRNERPLVGLHGWQDNAGTFDTLAPYLPNNMSFLALDLPGHGHSSWYPEGMQYHSWDCVILLSRIMEEFKWNKISLMGHSMSSINSFVFSALLPDKVDMLIGLDVLKPVIPSGKDFMANHSRCIEECLKQELQIRDKAKFPCYEWKQLVQRLHSSSGKSVDLETCKFLLKRNVKASQHELHKYYISRDSRWKTTPYYTFPHNVTVEMAKCITCPHLFIKALHAPYYEKKEYFNEVLSILKRNPKFEYHEVEGTHHVHLNEPEKVAKIINPFLQKWKL